MTWPYNIIHNGTRDEIKCTFFFNKHVDLKDPHSGSASAAMTVTMTMKSPPPPPGGASCVVALLPPEQAATTSTDGQGAELAAVATSRTLPSWDGGMAGAPTGFDSCNP